MDSHFIFYAHNRICSESWAALHFLVLSTINTTHRHKKIQTKYTELNLFPYFKLGNEYHESVCCVCLQVSIFFASFEMVSLTTLNNPFITVQTQKE